MNTKATQQELLYLDTIDVLTGRLDDIADRLEKSIASLGEDPAKWFKLGVTLASTVAELREYTAEAVRSRNAIGSSIIKREKVPT